MLYLILIAGLVAVNFILSGDSSFLTRTNLETLGESANLPGRTAQAARANEIQTGAASRDLTDPQMVILDESAILNSPSLKINPKSDPLTK